MTDKQPASVTEALARLVEEFGSVESARGLADTWRSQLPGRLEQLRLALSAGDANAAGRMAHILAGTTGLLGGAPVEQVARGLEASARAGEPDWRARAEQLDTRAREFDVELVGALEAFA